MRLAIVIAAFGFALGAPLFAPTGLMNHAQAQFTETLPSAEKATFDAAVAAIFADTTLTANQKRDRLTTLVQNSSNPTAAARVLVASAANQPTALQQVVGSAMSQVATNLQSTDPMTASNIVTVVATSPAVEVQIGYATYHPTQPTQQQTGNTNQVVTPTVTRRATTTRRVVVPPRPRIPTEPTVPVIPEPNPSQAGSPT